jgi:translation initiation factor 6
MEAAKYKIMGSDYVGVFATATDDIVFAGSGLTKNSKDMLSQVLQVKCIEFTVSGSDLVGLFSRANSKGIVLSNLTLDHEIEMLKKMDLGLNIGVVHSDLNALGSNILANDKIAVLNPDYDREEGNEIADILDVEIIYAKMDGFKTVGANNILTNSGLVINNRGTAQEEMEWNKFSGFTSVRTTANTGGLAIGLSVIANSNAVVAGDSTTGYELSRIMDALE